MKLLSINSDTKTIKSNQAGAGYLTAIMYLAPADIVQGLNTCPMAEKAQCKNACLYSAGRAAIFPAIYRARIARTEFYRDNLHGFLDQLKAEIRAFIRKCEKLELLPAVRLNGTSDIPWENVRDLNGHSLMECFPDVQFYDYTKMVKRKTPSNYHLTASYSGANTAYVNQVKQSRHNIAVVFRDKVLPSTFLGRPVINGDLTDLRFLDPAGVVVGLYAKGKAKKDKSGFVVDIGSIDPERIPLQIL